MRIATDRRANWVECDLDQVVDILDSQRVPVNADEREKRLGNIPYYGATGQVGWIDEYLFDEELVLLGEDGAPFLDPTRPKAYMIRGKSWVNNHAHALRAVGGIPNAWILYSLNQTDFRSVVSGTTRLKLPQGPMRRIRIRLAPLDEQHRIVAEIEKHLTRLEAAVAALKRAQARLRRYRAAVLQAAIQGKLSANSEAAGEPNWPLVRLGDFLREPLRNGFSGRPSNATNAVRCLTLTSVTRNDFSPENTKLVDPGDRKIDGLWLQPGDIFVERSNTPELVGTAALFRGEPAFAIFPDLLIRVRTKGELLPPFALIWLQSQAGRNYFRGKAQGIAGSMPKIDQQAVESFVLRLPPPTEQQRIVTEVEGRLSVLESLASTVDHSLKRASRLHQSLLQLAFEGRLVPQDPNDEPASILLERIRAERARTPSNGRRPRSSRSAEAVAAQMRLDEVGR